MYPKKMRDKLRERQRLLREDSNNQFELCDCHAEVSRKLEKKNSSSCTTCTTYLNIPYIHVDLIPYVVGGLLAPKIPPLPTPSSSSLPPRN